MARATQKRQHQPAEMRGRGRAPFAFPGDAHDGGDETRSGSCGPLFRHIGGRVCGHVGAQTVLVAGDLVQPALMPRNETAIAQGAHTDRGQRETASRAVVLQVRQEFVMCHEGEFIGLLPTSVNGQLHNRPKLIGDL